jgi:hypothetical protein
MCAGRWLAMEWGLSMLCLANIGCIRLHLLFGQARHIKSSKSWHTNYALPEALTLLHAVGLPFCLQVCRAPWHLRLHGSSGLHQGSLAVCRGDTCEDSSRRIQEPSQTVIWTCAAACGADATLARARLPVIKQYAAVTSDTVRPC